jgi:type VI protein secretion system component Hcp
VTLVLRRYPNILLASALALAGSVAAPALSKAPPPDPGSIKGESTSKDHKDWMQSSSTHCTRNAQPVNGVASDPEEGGEVTARKAHVGEINISKRSDSASTKLMERTAPETPC